MTDEMRPEPVTGAVERYAGPVEGYRPQIVLAPEEAKALDDALRANMRAVLHEDSDYGVIPGTRGKPSLLKPGAEKLLQWFGFGHTMERREIEREDDGTRIGVTYGCTVTKSLPDGRLALVATCEGYAGYDEDRFYTSAADAEAKERANAEKYERRVNPLKCVEYRAPWNSVIKMAQKRAMVGAALQATSASSLFTQDMEDAVPDVVLSPVQAIAGPAGQLIRFMPAEVKQKLDAWIKGQGWPARSEWDLIQWCEALVEAGRFDGANAGGESVSTASQQASSTSPEPAAAAPAGQQDPAAAGWLTYALDLATRYADADAGLKLWKETGQKLADGVITKADADHIADLIRARREDLHAAADADVVEGVIVADLEPEDPWAPRIADIACEADAIAVQAELDAEAKAQDMALARHAQITGAIEAKRASLGQVAA